MENNAATRALVARIIDAAKGPVLLDAGALSGVEQNKKSCARVLMTPHLGEMASLIDEDVDSIEGDQLGQARRYARSHGVSLALKGASTVVCDGAGAAWVFTGGTVGLGTSGSGDVLAGLVAGLVARGATPAQALVWGVWVHGEAGRRLSQRIGAVGFLARELLPEIPVILQSLSPRKARR
jgi:ADP-dependent NAD(P)H-hydrate dehydratase